MLRFGLLSPFRDEWPIQYLENRKSKTDFNLIQDDEWPHTTVYSVERCARQLSGYLVMEGENGSP